MGMKIDPTDMVGKRLGHLLVTKYIGRTTKEIARPSLDAKTKLDYVYKYACHCDCGNDCIVSRNALQSKRKQKVRCGRSCPLTPKPKIKPRIREAKRIGDNAIYWCEYTNYRCSRSYQNSLCCHECDKREECEDRCLNNPEKCGAPRREEVK